MLGPCAPGSHRVCWGAMRILIAPQELKGTLTAVEAAEAIARGVRRARPDAELDVAPIADGGPGTVDVILSAVGGERRVTRVRGPLGALVDAAWAVIDGGDTAVVEMAAASGLTLLQPEELDPRRASTYGTGELVRAALDAGCRRIIIGVGGSATNDGGTGAAAALGMRFLDAGGAELPPGGSALAHLDRVDLGGRDARLGGTEMFVATDVVNPLCGPQGASAVYGPQKGADSAAVRELDAALAHLASVVWEQMGLDLANLPGAGAAGGLAYGLVVFCAGKITPGFALVADILGLEERIAAADVVVTGEGRLDSQTLQGKGPGEVAREAQLRRKHTVIFAGALDLSSKARGPFDEVVVLCPPGMPLEEARAHAAEWLQREAEAWARRLVPAS